MSYADTIFRLTWDGLPADVQVQAKRCLKDIIATAAGSLLLPVGDRVTALVRAQYQSGPAPAWFRGECLSTVGAAYANAQSVDSLDYHDGFRPNKGHCGATVVPVVVGACAASAPAASGADLLAAVVTGYEVASRAGLALHALYGPHYHASGAWAALGAAAGAAKLAGVSSARFDEVVGMAEYYAPMSPILQCTKHPSVVKGAAGAGAWAAAMALALEEAGGGVLPSRSTNPPSSGSTSRTA